MRRSSTCRKIISRTAALLFSAVLVIGASGYPVIAAEGSREVQEETIEGTENNNAENLLPEGSGETAGSKEAAGSAEPAGGGAPEGEKPTGGTSEPAGEEPAAGGGDLSAQEPQNGAGNAEENPDGSGSTVKETGSVQKEEKKAAGEEPELSVMADGAYDVSSGDVNISGNGYFEVKGTTDENRIIINGGTADDPVEVNLLGGLSMDLHKGSDDNARKSSPVIIQDGSYVILYICRGDAGGRVLLHGGNDHGFGSGKNDGYAAIRCEGTSYLTISGDGYLEAYGGADEEYGGAAIGTNYDTSVKGWIKIDGNMTVKATGGHSAPGIGPGRNGNVEGSITITNGTVEAYGGAGSAAIGASENGDLKDVILIEGGTVRAYGGRDGAGIGMSKEGKAYDGDGGLIKITGGNITAQGGVNGAGIGGGYSTSGGICVEIEQKSGLTINATGGEDAAGIGSGDGDMKYVKIRLAGGTINAQGGEHGAGIGGGDNIESIDITGTGTIVATGGDQGCGIGAGNNSEVSSHLTIEGDSSRTGDKDNEGDYGLNITASASNGGNDKDNQAAAIGGGKAGNGNITIKNAKLTTHAGGQGADIGGGSFHAFYGGTVDTITIENCSITSTSTKKVTSGIGSGYGGSVNHIIIKNTHYSGGGIGASLMDANYLGLNSIKSIEISDSDIHAYWNENDPGHCTDALNFAANDLEHGAAGIGSGQYGSMDTITITNSKIYAHGFGSGAGIGTGGRGAYTLWAGLDKLDIGDLGEISITGSEVEAYSGYANFSEGVPTTIGDITVDPMELGSGAGIGSGCGSECGKVYMKDCPKVYAKGFAGAGIGAGNASGATVAGEVKLISLDNCDDVTALGGRYSAGIGTSGGDGMRVATSSTLSGIEIKNCKKVYAAGGSDAAGIGCGLASSYETGKTESGFTISIENSSVTARGGENGAGIGGGYEHGLGYGGDCPTVLIKGSSCVEAYGGTKGAGIGGGFLGGGKNIEIDLDEDDACIAKGTYDNPSVSKYYVKAEGKDGAAGIGGGGDDYYSGEFTKNNSTDFGQILIKGGAVFAQGGATIRAATYDGEQNWYNTGDFNMGAGAGIGGSAGASHVDKIEIDHGFIWARGGAYSSDSDRACDIGTGGDYSNAKLSDNDLSGDLIIKDGTVLAEKADRFKNVTINGGSVQAAINGAKNSSGEAVYQTTGRIDKSSTVFSQAPEAGKISIDNLRYSWFGKDHIYTGDIADHGFWLYLPQYSDADKKELTADVKFNEKDFHYSGYTDTENTGVVKMEGGLFAFDLPAHPVTGDEFDAVIRDSAASAGTKWTGFAAEGSAGVVSVTNDTSPGAAVRLKAAAPGEYTVSAQCDEMQDNPCYWSARAESAGRVKEQGEIAVTGPISKKYDGIPIEDPAVTTNSDGEVTYAYKDKSNYPVERPVDVNIYYVKASVAETDNYTAAETAWIWFEIYPADTTISQEMEVYVDPNDGREHFRIIAEVQGILEDETQPGKVKFKVYDSSIQDDFGGYKSEPVVKTEDGRFIATHEAGVYYPHSYGVDVVYDPDDIKYNECDNHRSYDNRTAEIEGSLEYEWTYGDGLQALDLTTNIPEGRQVWAYEVSSDTGEKYGAPSVALTDWPNVRVDHAGTATVKVTVFDTKDDIQEEHDHYQPQTVNVTITVKQAELDVKSAAYRGSEKTGEAVYGQTEDLTCGLEAEGFTKSGASEEADTLENFTHGYGTLEAQSLDARLDAGTYEIGVSRIGVQTTVDGVEYDDFFFSRDYKLNIIPGTLEVEPAGVVLRIADAEGLEGEEEPAYSWSYDEAESRSLGGGLASWDTEDDILAEGTAVARDPDLLPGDYPDLAAGIYQEALLFANAEEGASITSPNYKPVRADSSGTEAEAGYYKGSLQIFIGDLSNEDRFEISVSDTVYSGTLQKQKPTVTDTKTDAVLTEGVDYYSVWSGDCTNVGTASVQVIGQGSYLGQQSAVYNITPAPAKLITGSLEKVYDGTPLTCSSGSIEGLVNGETADIVFTGSITDAGSKANTAYIAWTGTAVESNYRVTESFGTLMVIKASTKISFTESPEKVYDGAPAEEPGVQTDSTGAIRYIWYNSSGQELSQAPVKAGKYKVGVRQDEDAGHNAGFAELEFEILKAPTEVTQEVRAEGLAGTVTAYVTGVYEPDGADGSVTFTIVKDGSEMIADHRKIPVTVTGDGRLKADITYEIVPAGKYEITAEYEPESGNYEPSSDVRTSDKALANRGISVTEQWEKTYGDAAFALDAAVEEGKETAGDVWNYEVIYDSFSQYGAEPAVSVDETGNVSVLHAGRAVIEVRLTDGGAGLYEDAAAYVTVDVARVPLTVTSYAYSEKGETVKADYGTVGSLEFALKYEGLKGGDAAETFTHGYGTLEAVPVPAAAAASEEPYEIGIAKNGVTVETGRHTFDNLFISRDYELTLANGTLLVEAPDVSDGTRFEVTETSDVAYNGTEQKQPVKVTDKGTVPERVLTEGTDYTLVYSENRTDAGTVSVTVAGKGNYSGTEDRSYKIVKAPLSLKTESAEKAYDGTPLTAGGTLEGFVNGETAGLVMTGSITDAGTAENTAYISWETAQERNYQVTEEIGTLTVTKEDPEIVFTEDPGKVYDSLPAREPGVKTGSTEKPVYRWYDGEGNPLDAAPAAAGSYSVEASIPENANYKAGSVRADFEIVPAQTMLSQKVTAEGTAVTVFAYAAGTYPADGADGSITFTVVRNGSEVIADHQKVPVERLEDGRLCAKITGDWVEAAGYEVTAEYESESGNYKPSSDVRNYDKALADRQIEVKEQWNKVYGDAGFALNAETEEGKETAGDVWTYEVVYDSFSQYGAEPAVSVDEAGRVTVLHAGRAVIEVRLTDGGAGLYEDASACVTIDVARVPLTVTSYASSEKGVTLKADYGMVGSLEFALKYEGLKGGDTGETFTHGCGTLEAVSVPADAAASEKPYEIGIARKGAAVTAGEHEFENLFLSRDYELTLVNGTLLVTAPDVSDESRFEITQPEDVVYSGTEQKQPVKVTDKGIVPERVLTEGTDYTLAYSENRKDAGTVSVTVAGTGNYAGTVEKSYQILKAPLILKTESAEKAYDGTPLTAGGSLEGLVNGETAGLVVTGTITDAGTAENTAYISWETAKERNYDVTEEIGTLTVTKADPEITFTENPGKVYDSLPAREPGVKTGSTEKPAFRWYDGVGNPLDAAPAAAGSYSVEASIPENANYKAGSVRADFEIVPAQTMLSQKVTAEGTAVTVFAYAAGTYPADGADGSITFTVVRNGSEVIADHQKVPVERLEDGRLCAKITGDWVEAAGYEVTAEYESESGNYKPSSNVRNYDKALADRQIEVQEQWNKAYGDAAFALNAETEEGKETAGDVWTYEVVYDSFSQYGAEPAVSVDEAGNVTVLHAGNALIEITLSDGGAGLYGDAKAYAAVTVSKAPLEVTSYACTEKGETDKASYGTVGSLEFALKYEGLKGGDTGETFTHGCGTLEAVPVPADAAASEKPYEIGILRRGVTVEADGQIFAGLFLSRDYELTLTNGTLLVEAADISDTERFLSKGPSNVSYNGKEQKGTVIIADQAGAEQILLKEGRDYELAYEGDLTNAGTVTVAAKGTGNYTGTLSFVYEIRKIPAFVVTDSAEKVYDGRPLTAEGRVRGIAEADAYTFETTGSLVRPGTAVNTYKLTFADPSKAGNYIITESLGTLTVTESEVLYRYDGSGDVTWTQGDTQALKFVFKRSVYDEVTYRHFDGAAVDGKELTEKDFSARSGSLILELQPEYLGTLAVGKHTLKVRFDDGNDPEAEFIIQEKAPVPTVTPTPAPTKTPVPGQPFGPGGSGAKTGDEADAQPWLLLVIACAACIAVTLHIRRRG